MWPTSIMWRCRLARRRRRRRRGVLFDGRYIICDIIWTCISNALSHARITRTPSETGVYSPAIRADQSRNVSAVDVRPKIYYSANFLSCSYIHTYARLTALFMGLPGWAGTKKVTPIWILLEQETVSGSGISWAICKSAHSSRQITTPAPHHSVFLQAGCPSCCPTNSVKAFTHTHTRLTGDYPGEPVPER